MRLAYEAVLTLFLALTTALLCLAFWFEPFQDERLPLVLIMLAGFVGTLVVVPLRIISPMTALVLGALLSLLTAGSSVALILLGAAVGYRSRRASSIGLGLAAVLMCCVAGVDLQTRNPFAYCVLLGLMLFCLTVLLPAAVGAMVAQRRLLVMTMHQRNVELHQERQLLIDQAQMRERNRIAAELHDSLGSRLTLLSLYTGGLAQSSAATLPPKGQEALALMRDTSAQAMSELRQILRVLHQDDVRDAAGRSLNEVEETVASGRGTGTDIELVRRGEPRPLRLLAEHAGYRVVQEGITNALRHAGGAPVRVEVRYEDDALVVEVGNRAGQPYEGISTGQGLHGLAERVRLAGGVLSHGPTDEGGFRLLAMLPYGGEVPEPGRTPANGDFPQELRKSSRRQRMGAGAVIVSLVLSLGSCVGTFFVPATPGAVSRELFDSLTVGDDQVAVDENLPIDMVETTVNTDGVTCTTYYAQDRPSTGDGELHYEICFKDGVLDSKRELIQ
ncbi:two-component sensor histidine kinase [Kineosporia sp. NBRC 101731]|nr:two-component sensor histidine kinase [Kineosporia sp. NBRC 101731]